MYFCVTYTLGVNSSIFYPQMALADRNVSENASGYKQSAAF